MSLFSAWVYCFVDIGGLSLGFIEFIHNVNGQLCYQLKSDRFKVSFICF